MGGESLYKTKFMVKLIDICTQHGLLLSFLFNNKKRIKDMTGIEKHLVQCLRTAFNINKTMDQLEFVPTFLEKYPLKEYYQEKGIEINDYFQYHIENHIIKTRSLLDQMCLLVRHIFRLGIPKKKINYFSIIENENLAEKKCRKILEEFNKSLQPISNKRNLIIHHGEFREDTLSNLARIYLVKSITNPDPKNFKMIEEKAENKMKSKLIKSTQDKNDIIHSSIINFYESLVDDFQKELRCFECGKIQEV